MRAGACWILSRGGMSLQPCSGAKSIWWKKRRFAIRSDVERFCATSGSCMQPDERDSGYLWDMLDSARTIQQFTKRSEEHTSELQSLMRISYAVFCLKKKKTNNHRSQ